MSAADGEDTKRDDELELDEDRIAILQRRRKFVSAALGGLAMATTVLADCAPTACLTAALDRPTQDATDSMPQPCLDMEPIDVQTFDASDASPQPCLDMAITDSGNGD